MAKCYDKPPDILKKNDEEEDKPADIPEKSPEEKEWMIAFTLRYQSKHIKWKRSTHEKVKS